MNKLNLKNNF